MKLEALSGMQNLPTWLRIAINHYGYITLIVLPAAVIALLLGIGGYNTLDLVVVAVLAIVVVAIWSRIHARQSPNAPRTTEALTEKIEQNGKYAMVALESEFCLSSTTVGARLSELEAAHPDKFQIFSLSIFKDPGKRLFEQYKAKVTPTYVLLDPHGKVVMDWPLVLPVEKVTYAVTQELKGQQGAQ
jgi:thioredoxin-related protein